jgi:hypothetical protein
MILLRILYFVANNACVIWKEYSCWQWHKFNGSTFSLNSLNFWRYSEHTICFHKQFFCFFYSCPCHYVYALKCKLSCAREQKYLIEKIVWGIFQVLGISTIIIIIIIVIFFQWGEIAEQKLNFKRSSPCLRIPQTLFLFHIKFILLFIKLC